MQPTINAQLIEISNALNWNQFFKLSGYPVPIELCEKINLGRKFCPRYTPVFRHESLTFYQDAAQLFNAYLVLEHRVKFKLNPHHLCQDLTNKISSLRPDSSSRLVETLKLFCKSLCVREQLILSLSITWFPGVFSP